MNYYYYQTMLNQNKKIYWKLYNDIKNATYHGVMYTSHSHSVIYSLDILQHVYDPLLDVYILYKRAWVFFAILFDNFVHYNMKSNEIR